MFIDTSAFIAILTGERLAGPLADAIARTQVRATSPVVRLEACMRLSTMLDLAPEIAQALFDEMLMESGVEVVALKDEIGKLAVAAFQRFGKGRNSRAKLNLADCLSYACARYLGVPILCIGGDFTVTDLPLAFFDGAASGD